MFRQLRLSFQWRACTAGHDTYSFLARYLFTYVVDRRDDYRRRYIATPPGLKDDDALDFSSYYLPLI